MYDLSCFLWLQAITNSDEQGRTESRYLYGPNMSNQEANQENQVQWLFKEKTCTVGFNFQKWAFFPSSTQKLGTIGEIWCWNSSLSCQRLASSYGQFWEMEFSCSMVQALRIEVSRTISKLQ
jgi:hypothetical protein